MRPCSSGLGVEMDVFYSEKSLYGTGQIEAAIADQRKAEASIAETRERLTETSEVFNDAQAKFYKIGGEIGRLEQSIEHNRQMRERRAADLKQAESGVAEILAHIEQDSTALQQLNLTLDQ